jgi:hypothetical protein
MKPARWTTLLLLIVLGGIVLVVVRRLSRPKPLALPATPMRNEPLTMLWAWEAPEDLTALDPSRTGVAFLSREIAIRNSGVSITPRRQPLDLAPNTWLMADVRIDAPNSLNNTPEVLSQIRRKAIAAILPATQLPNVRALQLDFDATASQLPFYAALLRELKPQLPPGMPLSITALTSWCGPQSWLPELGITVDEAVPMFFRMGGTPSLRASSPKDIRSITQPLCATSSGVATDETWPNLHTGERVYIFRTGPWTKDDLQRLNTLGPTSLNPASRPPVSRLPEQPQ